MLGVCLFGERCVYAGQERNAWDMKSRHQAARYCYRGTSVHWADLLPGVAASWATIKVDGEVTRSSRCARKVALRAAELADVVFSAVFLRCNANASLLIKNSGCKTLAGGPKMTWCYIRAKFCRSTAKGNFFNMFGDLTSVPKSHLNSEMM